MKRTSSGFTIVELLIVIVVIGILAAITIVAYNGIQTRAQAAQATAEINGNAKKAMNQAAINGTPPTTLDVLSTGSTAFTVNSSLYRLMIYCRNATDFAIAVEMKNGARYYAKSDGAVQRNDTLDIYSCANLGVASGTMTPLTIPGSTCAAEHGSCTFSGTGIIAYGNAPTLSSYFIKTGQTSPVACTNPNFGDPASGYVKYCYVLATY